MPHSPKSEVVSSFNTFVLRRAFFAEIYGLPAGYNAFRSANFGSPAEWELVHVLHDVWKVRSRIALRPLWMLCLVFSAALAKKRY